VFTEEEIWSRRLTEAGLEPKLGKSDEDSAEWRLRGLQDEAVRAKQFELGRKVTRSEYQEILDGLLIETAAYKPRIWGAWDDNETVHAFQTIKPGHAFSVHQIPASTLSAGIARIRANGSDYKVVDGERVRMTDAELIAKDGAKIMASYNKNLQDPDNEVWIPRD